MSDTEKIIAGDLRIIVRNAVQADQTLVNKIATGLRVPQTSVLNMLEAKRWDLPLAMKVIDIIRVAVFVVTVQDRTPPVSRARTRPVTMTLDSLAKAAERASGTRTAAQRERDPVETAKGKELRHDEMLGITEGMDESELSQALKGMTDNATARAKEALPKSAKRLAE